MKPVAALRGVDVDGKATKEVGARESVTSRSSGAVVATIIWLFLIVPAVLVYILVQPGRDHGPAILSSSAPWLVRLSSFFHPGSSERSQPTASADAHTSDSLRINFNISFTKMSCEHITLDASDSRGLEELHLSKTPLTTDPEPVPVSAQSGGSERGAHGAIVLANTNFTAPMTAAQFRAAQRRYPLLLVNFCAPWAPYCKAMAPAWEALMQYARKAYPASEGRILVSKVDCPTEPDLCVDEAITGYPSVRIYRNGSDKLATPLGNRREQYSGDRTYEVLKDFVDDLVSSTGPAPVHAQEKQASVMDSSAPNAEPRVMGALDREEDAASLPQRDVEGLSKEAAIGRMPPGRVDRDGSHKTAARDDTHELYYNDELTYYNDELTYYDELTVPSTGPDPTHTDMRAEPRDTVLVADEDADGRATVAADKTLPAIAHDNSEDVTSLSAEEYAEPLTAEEFRAAQQEHPLLMVNFYAPWCPNCNRLAPAWEALMDHARTTYPAATDGRVRVARVDCAAEQELCKEEAVTGYATMRIYRRDSRGHKYVSYGGGRTEEELTGFLDTLASASLPEPPQPSAFEDAKLAGTEYAALLTPAQFRAAQQRYPLLVVNFYAAWCPWSKKLLPKWMEVMEYARTMYPTATDGRIRVARVDCTVDDVVDDDLCTREVITGFPSVRIYRNGSDEYQEGAFKRHEQYRGDRTVEALTAFIDGLVPSAGLPPGQTLQQQLIRLREIPARADLASMGSLLRGLKSVELKDHEVEADLPAHAEYAAPMTAEQFREAQRVYPLLVVNFDVPWCPSCRKMAPKWEAVMEHAHAAYPATDGRIRVGRVNCTAEQALCKAEQITGYPSIRVYRDGSDDILVRGGYYGHEMYRGARTYKALKAFVDGLVTPAGAEPTRDDGMAMHVANEGAMVSEGAGDRFAGQEGEHVEQDAPESADYSAPMTAAQFHAARQRHPFLMVNFFAPWTPWQELYPIWEAAMLHTRTHPLNTDGRVRVAHVDCSVDMAFCKGQKVTHFPWVRTYRDGVEDVMVEGERHVSDTYQGDDIEGELKALVDKVLRLSARTPLSQPRLSAPHSAGSALDRVSLFVSFTYRGSMAMHVELYEGARVGEEEATAAAAMRERFPASPRQPAKDDLLGANYSAPMTAAQFRAAQRQHPLLLVNFYAAWCPFSQKLLPEWLAVMEHARSAYPDGRVRVARVDCAIESSKELCNEQRIAAFPTIRVYRDGSDDIIVGGNHVRHRNLYKGDRTEAALTAFVDDLARDAHPTPTPETKPPRRPRQGCMVAGHVIAKRAPGTLSFHMRHDGAVAPASPDTDVSHRVHHLTFGPPAAVEGTGDSHRDSLADAAFAGPHPNMTHEHTLRLTAVAPNAIVAAPGAYEYTVESRSYVEDPGALPAARFTVQLPG